MLGVYFTYLGLTHFGTDYRSQRLRQPALR